MVFITRPDSLWGKEKYGIEQATMRNVGFDLSRAGYMIAHEQMNIASFPMEKEMSLEIINEVRRTGGKKLSYEFKAMTAKKYLNRAIQSLDNIGV